MPRHFPAPSPAAICHCVERMVSSQQVINWLWGVIFRDIENGRNSCGADGWTDTSALTPQSQGSNDKVLRALHYIGNVKFLHQAGLNVSWCSLTLIAGSLLAEVCTFSLLKEWGESKDSLSRRTPPCPAQSCALFHSSSDFTLLQCDLPLGWKNGIEGLRQIISMC